MKSIIFNQHQVNYALRNKEGMFRVVVKPYLKFNEYVYFGNSGFAESEVISNKSPYQVKETIFVKETWGRKATGSGIAYKVDNPNALIYQHLPVKWKLAQHMKQEHSRLTLRIKSVKMEKLQDISEEDCYKSGVECLGGSQIADTGDYFESEYYFGELEERIRECGCDATIEHCDKCYADCSSTYSNTYDNPFEPFVEFWNATHKKQEEKWEANPWVFAYEYEVVKK